MQLQQHVFPVDIDTIEIRSDEEEGSGATKARRTYNYRVCNFIYLLLLVLCVSVIYKDYLCAIKWDLLFSNG